MTADAFVAKLAPGGSEVLWSTFLGGSDFDAAASITLDEHGNVYVAGNTSSADFPVTTTRAGPSGQQDAFLVKFDPEGRLVYSTAFGGESLEEAMGLAVNAAGEAHLVGRTTSKSFPATPGAFETQAGLYDGFAVKLRPDGAIAYASYLPEMAPPASGWRGHYPPRLVSVAEEASGSILIGANVWMANVLPGTIFRMNPNGSTLTKASRLPGLVYAMETDRQGDVYVAGQITMGSKSGICFQGWRISDLLPGDIFVTKLQSESLQEVYSARLYGKCQSWPRTLKVGPTGEVSVGVWTLHDFPLHNPVMMVRACGVRGIAAVSRLSADGSTVLFSSYLDACWQSPTVAPGPEGSLYAGITQNSPSGHASVLQLPVAQADGMWVESAVNAFSGVLGPVGPNMLLTITGQNLASEFIDLGLNYALPLPTQLGGVQVLFNDIPAEIFQVAPDHVICVPPASVQNQKQASVQVLSGIQRGTPFVLPSTYATLGLLTRAFPGLPPAGVVDGSIRNADGTLNDAQHPAAPGSTVTLFATGLSGPRDIALLWNAPASQPDPTGLSGQYIYSLYGKAYHAPGLMDALYAIDFRIPDAPGKGVYLVPVPGVLTRAVIGQVDSGLGVYVK